MTYSTLLRRCAAFCFVGLLSAGFFPLFSMAKGGFFSTEMPEGSRPAPADLCPRPELLQANLVTDSTARLTWSDVGDLYEIELVAGTGPFTGIPTHVVNADPPFDVTGLTPGRNYRFQVRTLCDDTTSSQWSNPRSFITDLNNARPCPLNLDLRDTSCNNLQIFKLHVDVAPGLSLGTDVRLQGVRIMVEHPWRSDLEIWLRSPDSTRIQLIGGLNAGDQNIGDPQGTPCAQFVELSDDAALSRPLSSAAEQDNVTGYFLPVQPLATLHTGQNPVGVWTVEFCDNKTAHRGTLRLFELVFARTDCAGLNGVSVGNVTENSAQLNWQADALGDSLLIEYGPAGFLPGTAGTAGTGAALIRLAQPATPPLVLTGLQTLVHYQAYIRRQCAPGLWGPNSAQIEFFTNCSPSLLETADTLAPCAVGCTDPCPLPGIWQNAPGDDFEWKVYSGPSLFYPVAGPPAGAGGAGNYLYFRNSCSPTGAFGKTAVLRTLCVQVEAPPAQTCHFSFDLYMNTKTGQMSNLALQASTDGGQHWGTLQTWSGNRGKLWRREYVNLSAYDGQIALFQFVATGTFGVYGDLALDNLAFYGSQEAGTPDYNFYRDADNDTYGDPEIRVISCFPTPPPGYVATAGDCDDGAPAVHPGATEILCNQADENCNGMADDALLPPPAAPAGTSVCSGGNTVLSASGTPLGQFFWYENSSGGSAVAVGKALILNNLTASKTYYLADSLTGPGAGCSSARVPATVTVHPNPALVLNAAPAICDGSTFNLATLPLADTANTGGIVTYHSATPPGPANQLPSSVVQPSFTRTYYLLSTTAFGCTGTRSVTVTVRPRPEVQIAQGDSVSTCRGRTVQLQAQELGAGQAPIAFAWSTGLNFPNIPVQAGNTPSVTKTYTVTATDANGCTGTDQIKVHTLNNVTQTAVESIQQVSICGGMDGSITLRPLNGTPPYTFSWPGGSLPGVVGTGTIAGLKQGSYRVTVTDATNAGCSMVMPQIVLNAPGLTVALDTIIHPACPGAATGSIVLNVNGQNPTFQWSNQQTGATAQALGEGSYSVTITDGNCSQTLSNLEVTAPPPIEINLNGLENVRCFADSNGSIDLAVFGATPPYQFAWSNGAVSEDLSDLTGDTYDASITDAHGCIFQTQTYTVAEPMLLTVQLDSISNVRCFGEKSGYLRVKAAGGNGGYQYHWNTGATSPSLGNVSAGVYFVTVTDAKGCTAEWVGALTEPGSVQIEITLKTAPTCFGATDGSIELVMSGGQPPFQFSWSSGGHAAKENNLGVGVYKATVTDSKGCSRVSPSIVLSAPQLLSLTLDSLKNVDCRGNHTGAIALSLGGAVGGLNITWNGVADDLLLTNAAAGTYVVQVRDARACTIKDTFEITQPAANLGIIILDVNDALCAGEPTGNVVIRVNGGTLPYQFDWSNGAHTQNLPAVPAGQYGLTVTDARGCTAVLPPVTVGEPPALVAQATVHDIPCFGINTGDIQLQVSGGIPPYQFIWSNTATTQHIFSLPAGTYGVTILDATGCATVLSDLTVVDNALNFQLEPLLLQPVSCSGAADGAIGVVVRNGTPPYQFSWSPPIGVHFNVPVPADTVTALSGGEFFVTVTDAAGCSVVSPPFTVEEAPPLLLNVASIKNVICKGDSTGRVVVDVSGGVPAYVYDWNLTVAQDTALQLPAGAYVVTVRDSRGCTVVSPAAHVTEPALALDILLDQLKHDKCGKQEGAIQVHGTGGLSPYKYLWNNQAMTSGLSNLPAGDYRATVTDALGCTLISPPYTVQQLSPALLLLDTTIVDVPCKGDTTGAIVPLIGGGTPLFQYAWNAGPTVKDLLNVGAGHYVLTVVDGAGCVAFWAFDVSEPATALSATWTTDSVPGSGWTITLSPAGGLPSYDIRWDAKTGNQTGPVATGLAPGAYAVTLTDQNDCELVLSIPVGTFTGQTARDLRLRLLLAPNPSTDYALLQAELDAPTALHLRVFAVTGQLVWAFDTGVVGDRYSIPIRVRDWPGGVYWVRVFAADGRGKVLRLVKGG